MRKTANYSYRNLWTRSEFFQFHLSKIRHKRNRLRRRECCILRPQCCHVSRILSVSRLCKTDWQLKNSEVQGEIFNKCQGSRKIVQGGLDFCYITLTSDKKTCFLEKAWWFLLIFLLVVKKSKKSVERTHLNNKKVHKNGLTLCISNAKHLRPLKKHFVWCQTYSRNIWMILCGKFITIMLSSIEIYFLNSFWFFQYEIWEYAEKNGVFTSQNISEKNLSKIKEILRWKFH